MLAFDKVARNQETQNCSTARLSSHSIVLHLIYGLEAKLQDWSTFSRGKN